MDGGNLTESTTRARERLLEDKHVIIECVRLTRVGNYAAVSVCRDGEWVEIIREVYDNNFDHYVAAGGIRAAQERR